MSCCNFWQMYMILSIIHNVKNKSGNWFTNQWINIVKGTKFFDFDTKRALADTCQGALKIVEPDIVELASTVETLACVQHRSIFRSALQQRVLHANFHWSVLPQILIPSPQNIRLLGLRATSRTWNRLNSMHKVLYRVTEEHHIETLFLEKKSLIAIRNESFEV